MAVIVTKTFTTTCLGELKDAINANVIITTNLEQIVYAGGADTDFYFASALSGPEDTELDSVLAGWSCPPAPPSNDENVDDANGPDSDTVWTSDKITTDFVNVSGDTMTGALTVDAPVTTGDLRVQHDSNSDSDIIIDANGRSGASGASISRDGGSGFLWLFPNATTNQWIACNPANGTGVNQFFIDVDEEGTLFLQTLGGAGATGTIVATNNGILRPAGDGDSLLGTSSFRWEEIHGVDLFGSTLALQNGLNDVITIQPPAGAFTDYSLTLPVNDGDANQVLTTDGAGALSWTTPAPGGLSLAGLWKYSDTTTASDPGTGEFRLNNTNPSLATALYINDETEDGIDFSVILGAISIGDIIYLQNNEDAQEALLATVSSVTDNGSWYNFGITVNDSNGASWTNGKEFGFVFALGIADVDTGITELTGDVTAGPGSGAQSATIANDAVTYAKMQNVVADNVLLGNNSGAGSVVEELTATEVRSILNVGDGADVSSSGNIADNSVVRGDGGAKGIQDSNWSISDAGLLSSNTGGISVVASGGGTQLQLDGSTASSYWDIKTGRSGFFDNWLLFTNENEVESFTFTVTNSGQFRGKKGSAGAPTYSFYSFGGDPDSSNYGMSWQASPKQLVLSTEGQKRLFIDEDGQTTIQGDKSSDYILTVRNINATSGDGFRVRAGEALGDIAFSIEDSDGSFNIMQLEADQGFVTLGKTYAQTLTDNGVVYGVDQQGTGVTSDFNTQAGQYRIGGVPIPLAKFNMFADQVDFPRGSDWAINNGAPASADSNNSGFVVRRFDDTTPEAFGFQTGAPENAKEMIIITACRAETAPVSTQTVKLQLHFRSIPDNAPPSSWTTVNLTDVSIPTNENFQYDVTSNTLAGWGLTAGTAYQMQLSRNAGDAGDTLSGDMSMLGLTLEFR